jgi:hypothetical protein
MKIECECGESISIHKSKDPTLIVDWNDWITDHLFKHSAIYCREGDSFNLSFRASEPAPVKVFDPDTGEEITEQYVDNAKEELSKDLRKKLGV